MWIRSSLAQLMACHPSNTKPLSTPTNAGLLSIGPLQTSSVKLQLKYSQFHSTKCFRECYRKIMTLYFRPQCVNSLWLSDIIWWHRSRSTLAQVMACCLMAPCPYLNHCWLIRNIHLRAISQEVPQSSTGKISLKITHLKFHSNLPGPMNS